MSYKKGNVFIPCEEAKQVCEFCGKIEETRPYGKDGKEICFSCAQLPENSLEVEKNFCDILDGKKPMPYRNDISVI